MTTNRQEIIGEVTRLLEDALKKKNYGEYGIYITLHEGTPVKITEVNQINVMRRSEGRIEITK